jgi:mannosyltransferase
VSVETAAAPSAAPLRIARLRQIAFVLAIAGLTLLAAVLRDRALGAPLWIDEGLSVGIASHPFADIPNVLRVDGSPPLYYLLLHLWIAVAGDSEHATHLLSVLFAILAVPAAAWALLPVLGELAALSAAALVTLSPFVGLYADEGRMYSLVFLLGTLAAGAFLRVFVLRRRRWSFGCAGVFAALLYTHAWGAFFVATAGVAGLVLLAVARDRRTLFVDLLICFGGAALLFAPWLPIALEQSRHTAAPWSHAPSSRSLTRALTRMLTGIPPELVLRGAGGAGALLALLRGTAAQRRAVLALTAIAAGTLMLGYLASRTITPAWSFRYLVIVLAPLLLALGAGIARLGVLGVAAIAVVGLVMWSGKPSVHQLDNKSNVAAVSRALGPRLPRGSIVFSEQPEQVAALRYYLPAGLRYATPLGPVADPRVMDWRDAMARMRAASYALTLGRDVRGLRPGQRMLVVAARLSRPSSPWTTAIASIARRWTARVRADRRVRSLAVIRPRRFNNRSTVSAVLLVRRTRTATSRHPPGCGLAAGIGPRAARPPAQRARPGERLRARVAQRSGARAAHAHRHPQ